MFGLDKSGSGKGTDCGKAVKYREVAKMSEQFLNRRLYCFSLQCSLEATVFFI